jgi:hypothetical protein
MFFCLPSHYFMIKDLPSHYFMIKDLPSHYFMIKDLPSAFDNYQMANKFSVLWSMKIRLCHSVYRSYHSASSVQLISSKITLKF